MPHHTEFRLSELYLACRTLGARHWLTHDILNAFAMLSSPIFTRAVMTAPACFNEDHIIPFRRNPIDLRFVSMLVGSTGTAARKGFVICSDEAIGKMGALQIGTGSPTYSLEEDQKLPAILEEKDVFRALDCLKNPDIRHAQITVCGENADTFSIRLPAPVTPDHATGFDPDAGLSRSQRPRNRREPLKPDSFNGAFRFTVFPDTGKPEVLRHLDLRATDARQLHIEIGAEHLMISHHAGLRGFPFELSTADFRIRGRFPDLLDPHHIQTVRHSPVGLFHAIFKGLDDSPLTLPENMATQLRQRIHWLSETELTA